MRKADDIMSLADEAFPQLYAGRIEPILKAREVDRLVALRSFWTRGALGTVVSLGLGALARGLAGAELAEALLVSGVGLAVTGTLAYAPLAAVREAAKRQSLSAIADAIGCTYRLDGFDPDGLADFKSWSLLPGYDRISCRDRFAGRHHGCAFAFFDTHLQKQVGSGKNRRWKTVFNGQLVCIDFPKPFKGTTVIREDAGPFNFLEQWSCNLQRVGLGDSRLEKAFEVYASDQVEARVLIHPVFMERLLELEALFRGQHLRGAFHEGHLLLAIEGGDKFELGSMFFTLLDEPRVRAILADIACIVRVVDAVLTAERGSLPQ